MQSSLFVVFFQLLLTVIWTSIPAFADQGQGGTSDALLSVQGDLTTEFNHQGSVQGGGSTNSQGTNTKSDVLDKMIQMAKKCELILDCITEYENGKTNDDTIVESSCLPLLNDLQYLFLKSSCLTIYDASATANEAAISEFGQPTNFGSQQ